jgi:aminoglycoside phosphotransferase (APT) family kinase protein
MGSNDLDPDRVLRLERYIAEHVPGARGPLSTERIGGGQSNPTFFVTMGDRRMVLRMQPEGELLPSAHAVDREFRVMAALAGSGVPVPRMLAYSDDRAIVGTKFFLMERVAGRVFQGAEIPGVPATDRHAMYLSAVATLARLHKAEWRALGLGDFGKRGNYFRRQIERWTRQWQASRSREIPEIDRLIEWLPSRIPEDDRVVICHGDYRIGNLMFDAHGTEVAAVLDWELATLGHPLADLAFFCIPFHTAAAEYRGVRDLDQRALGIPSEAELVAHYSRVLGEPVALLPFHLAFALFRFAVIFVGIEARAAQGNAAGGDAASVGKLSGVFAARACSIAGLA